MSERDYSLTVRLSADERAELETLATRWGLDKSATMRRVLRMATDQQPNLPETGHFISLQDSVTFPVRLSRKVADER